MFGMAARTILSTELDPHIKKILSAHCKNKRLKIRTFLEDAILEKLEDDSDVQLYLERRNDEKITLAEAFPEYYAKSSKKR